MATRNCFSYSNVAHEDLSAKEYAFGKLVAGGIDVCDTLGERADCVIGNAPATGEAVQMDQYGKVKVKVGAVGVADGAELTPDANGLAKTAVQNNIVRAKAAQAGAAGEIIEAWWVDAYAKP